jgi:hypothetical protein
MNPACFSRVIDDSLTRAQSIGARVGQQCMTDAIVRPIGIG